LLTVIVDISLRVIVAVIVNIVTVDSYCWHGYYCFLGLCTYLLFMYMYVVNICTVCIWNLFEYAAVTLMSNLFLLNISMSILGAGCGWQWWCCGCVPLFCGEAVGCPFDMSCSFYIPCIERFIYLFIYLFIHSFIHPFIYSFIPVFHMCSIWLNYNGRAGYSWTARSNWCRFERSFTWSVCLSVCLRVALRRKLQHRRSH